MGGGRGGGLGGVSGFDTPTTGYRPECSAMPIYVIDRVQSAMPESAHLTGNASWGARRCGGSHRPLDGHPDAKSGSQRSSGGCPLPFTINTLRRPVHVSVAQDSVKATTSVDMHQALVELNFICIRRVGWGRLHVGWGPDFDESWGS